jgi:hypothetical protein
LEKEKLEQAAKEEAELDAVALKIQKAYKKKQANKKKTSPNE